MFSLYRIQLLCLSSSRKEIYNILVNIKCLHRIKCEEEGLNVRLTFYDT